MIYFDNAATSFPKPRSVIAEVNRCLRSYCGNPGRGAHKMSVKAAEEIYSAREKIASFLGKQKPEHVVFTYNATYALNLAIKSYVKENCHVLTSDFEHNSVIRPLEKLKKTIGLSYSVFSTDTDVEESVRSLIKENTVGIISSVASNVTGDEIDLSLLSKIASDNGLFLIIDASQMIGHKKIDLSKTPCDVICAPGHKALFGIQGCGFACFKDDKRRESFVEGGSGLDSESLVMPEMLPEAYEAGTLSTPAIVSLGCGIDYINKIGLDEIERKLNYLTEELKYRLTGIPEISLYKEGCGLLSFNLNNYPSTAISSFLDDYGVCVRGGLHCAPSIHKKLGTTDRGAVRVSLSYFNNIGEIDFLYRAIKEIAQR